MFIYQSRFCMFSRLHLNPWGNHRAKDAYTLRACGILSNCTAASMENTIVSAA